MCEENLPELRVERGLSFFMLSGSVRADELGCAYESDIASHGGPHIDRPWRIAPDF